MALEDYEDALKSYIHDDDKLVSYKWLSKEFEIHVNIAKDILKQYWEKHKDDEKIVATFLLAGQLKDRSIRVEVVKELNLNAAKEKFIKVDCEHLYSLQKSLHDIELLAFAGEGDLRYGAIKCNEEYVRNDEEIEGLRYIGNAKKEESTSKCSNKVPEKQVSKPIESFKQKPQNLKLEKDSTKEQERVDETEKLESKSETKTVIAEKKVSPTNKSTNTKINNKVTKKPTQSKQSGFNNLFGKVSNKSQASIRSKEDSVDTEKQENSLNDTKKENKTGSKEKEDEEKNQEKENNKNRQEKENIICQSEEKSKKVSKLDDKSKSKNKNGTRGQKRNRSQEKNASSKRKRIVVMDSSEDESNKSNADDEEEEAMEIEEEIPKVVRKRSPSPPAEKRENGKRMVRKTIDKTFKDEDGYLVTKRIHVYEVASDNEETEEIKKEESKKSKPMENKAKKQTSLMNFFKKS